MNAIRDVRDLSGRREGYGGPRSTRSLTPKRSSKSGRVIKSAKDIFAFNETARDRWIEANAKGIAPRSRVLDVGAGPCKYRRLFTHCEYKAHDFARYEGTEHSYGELDLVSDIGEIPVPDGSFDWIICTEVLEHVPRPDLALREFSRI